MTEILLIRPGYKVQCCRKRTNRPHERKGVRIQAPDMEFPGSYYVLKLKFKFIVLQ
jgi:hypothetical protein